MGIETERKLADETKEQLRFIGNQIEKRTIAGEAVIITEPERQWLGYMLEGRKVKLEALLTGETLFKDGTKPKGSYIGQGAKLEVAMGGRENLIGYIGKVMKMTLKKQENIDVVDDFLKNYFQECEIEEGKLINYKASSGKLMDTRVLAIMSATHRILRIIASKGEDKAIGLQSDDNAQKYLKDRILGGSGLPMSREDTRTLPPGAVGVIFRALLA